MVRKGASHNPAGFCRTCGVELNESNTYASDLKARNWQCRACRRGKSPPTPTEAPVRAPPANPAPPMEEAETVVVPPALLKDLDLVSRTVLWRKMRKEGMAEFELQSPAPEDTPDEDEEDEEE